MLSRTKAVIWTVLLTALLTMLLPPLHTKATETTPVRIGYYEDGDFMYRNGQGEYEGYNFEFLREVSKLSGLHYDIIDTYSWQNALQLLTDGNIDILPGVYLTEERKHNMLFTDQPMGTVYTTLNVRVNDTRYDYEDFAAFQGMQIGIIRNSEDGEIFKRYCVEHGMKVNIINYDETNELLNALDNSTLDGVAITHLGRNSSFRSVAQFSPIPIYVAVSKQRPDLLAQLNQACNDTLLRNPGYQMDLYDKYLSPGVNQKPVFTRDELEFINSAGPIRVSYDPAFAPLTYKNSEGNFSGAVADMFSLISESSGLEFQFEDNSPNEALELLKQGEIHMICLVNSDYLWDARNEINTTLYYLRTPSVLVTHATSEAIEKLALPKGYRLSEWVANNNPDKEILYFQSVEECFNAVLTNKAQATYINTYVANYLLSDLKYDTLNSTTLTQYTNDLCIGVSKSADPRLFSIVDKYIQYMPNEQMDNLLLNNAIIPKPISVNDFVHQHIWLVTGMVTAAFSSIILLLCINLRNISRSNHRIQNLLYQDNLTGLDNINRFYIRTEGLLRNAAEEPYAFVYCDIDRFKLINDNFGFEEGDHVLCAYGRILQQLVQGQECCARLSADNFVLLLKYDDWDTLIARLEHVHGELNLWRKEEGVILYKIGLSCGVYRVNQTESNDMQRMLDLANYARRHAKNDSGSTIVLYDKQMRQKALLEQELEGRLTVALEQHEFQVYYQPKVNMGTGEIIGSEALVRWNHPVHGLLMPGSFLPFFEKKGIIVHVDFYLYEAVCRSIRNWLDLGLHVTPVSCNFSRLHFRRSDFAKRVAEIADQWNIPHSLLEVEITESAIASDSESVGSTLLALKKLDFPIAIDDFGSGYSSLGQLQQLNADVLKLDRSFVSNGLLGDREQIVIENLVNMVNSLGMTVICEGVETRVQADVLQTLGCHFAQGFYFYRPMPLEAFEQLM